MTYTISELAAIPEVEFFDSGDDDYRVMAAVAVRRGQLVRDEQHVYKACEAAPGGAAFSVALITYGWV